MLCCPTTAQLTGFDPVVRVSINNCERLIERRRKMPRTFVPNAVCECFSPEFVVDLKEFSRETRGGANE